MRENMSMLGIFRHLIDSTAPGGIANSISGTFDIRGDVVAGFVVPVPCASNTGLRVQAIRGRQTLANCFPTRRKGERNLRFIIPMLGQFTPAEILRETVTIVARTDRGDTGILKMEGAARFELTHMVLGKKTETLLDLDFTRNGNARANQGKGWSISQDDFTWTLDNDSVVHLQSPTAFGAYMLRLRFSSFIWDALPIQTLDIFVNETQVDAFSATNAGTVFHEVNFDGSVFSETVDSTIRLYHPRAGRYSEYFETKDNRRVAFAFRRISLMRIVSTLDSIPV